MINKTLGQMFTCELVALRTCGECPEEVTVPEGGRFLLVTEAQENGCNKCNDASLRLHQPCAITQLQLLDRSAQPLHRNVGINSLHYNYTGGLKLHFSRVGVLQLLDISLLQHTWL